MYALVRVRNEEQVKNRDRNRNHLMGQETGICKELRDCLMEKKAAICEFDEQIFRRFIEKVRVISMVEVEFVFKVGVVGREVM